MEAVNFSLLFDITLDVKGPKPENVSETWSSVPPFRTQTEQLSFEFSIRGRVAPVVNCHRIPECEEGPRRATDPSLRDFRGVDGCPSLGLGAP